MQAVAELVKPGYKLADIGTDHAYLPIYLVQQGKIPSAIAIDVHQGPYKSALQQVVAQGLKEEIRVLLGNGLEPLHSGQVESAVLAGMGSTTMIDILEAKPEVTASLKQLVVQPMVGAAQARKWLINNDWTIDDELMVEDDGFIYIIISALPGKQVVTDWLAFELGPVILQKKPPLLKPYVNKIILDYEKILDNLKQARSKEAEGKKLELIQKINLLKGVVDSGFKG